jgi:WD40-like Beta Propeller Repeat
MCGGTLVLCVSTLGAYGGLSTAASAVSSGVTGQIVFDRLQGDFGYESRHLGTFTIDLSGSSEHEVAIDLAVLEGLSPTWSPDGNSLLINGSLSPATTDPDGSNLTFIEPDDLAGSLHCTAGSPDGSSLACTLDDDAHPESEGIYSVGVDGSNLTRITSSPNPHTVGSISECGGNIFAPDYSPDGSRIAFLRADCGPVEDPVGLVERVRQASRSAPLRTR